MNILVICLTGTCVADKSEGSTDIFHKMFLSIDSICWGAQSSLLCYTYFVYDH